MNSRKPEHKGPSLMVIPDSPVLLLIMVTPSDDLLTEPVVVKASTVV